MTAMTSLALALLVREGQVLLVHRAPWRLHHPDRWGLVGGHVEPGESPHEAVQRECHEEIGVGIQAPRPIPMTFEDPTLDVHAFLVTGWDGGEPVNAAPEEHDEIRWWRPDELAGALLAHPSCLPDIRGALELAAAEHRTGDAPRPPSP